MAYLEYLVNNTYLLLPFSKKQNQNQKAINFALASGIRFLGLAQFLD